MDLRKMDSAKSRSAGSTATVTPLLQRPKTAKSISAKAFDGFRPASDRLFAPANGGDGRHFDAKAAAYNIVNTPLVRRLKGRHLQMIAIGGSIGNTIISGFTPGSLLTGAVITQVLDYLSVLEPHWQQEGQPLF